MIAVNIIAYHLQQSLEFTLKYQLENNGVEYPKTHNISQLITLANNNNIDLKLSEYIDDHAEMFTIWESQSRYVLDYSVELKKNDRATSEISKYITNIE